MGRGWRERGRGRWGGGGRGRERGRRGGGRRGRGREMRGRTSPCEQCTVLYHDR